MMETLTYFHSTTCITRETILIFLQSACLPYFFSGQSNKQPRIICKTNIRNKNKGISKFPKLKPPLFFHYIKVLFYESWKFKHFLYFLLFPSQISCGPTYIMWPLHIILGVHIFCLLQYFGLKGQPKSSGIQRRQKACLQISYFLAQGSVYLLLAAKIESPSCFSGT